MRFLPLAAFLPRLSRRRLLKLMAALLLLGVPGTTRSQQPEEADEQVLTHHNNNARTGAYLHETRLNAQNVKKDTFGKLFSLTVDGQVYAQPLTMSHVEITGNGVHNGVHNVVFIATAHDSVYAFDADDHQGNNAQPLWHVCFTTSPPDPVPGTTPPPPAKSKKTLPADISTVRSADYDSLVAGAYQDLTPEIGIIGTPVIDPKTNRLYVVAATREKTGYVQRLHALNVSNGMDSVPPRKIEGRVEGIGDGGANNIIPFSPRQHLQRPGLLLTSDGVVYVAFGSHGDLPVNGFALSNLFNLLPGYHGWIFAYDAKNLEPLGIYNSTPNGGTSLLDLFKAQPTPAGGGIWMSGAGPAADAAGNVYFSTGNGTFDGSPAHDGNSDYGDSIVKLRFNRNAPFANRLTVEDYYTPSNQAYLNAKDLDLGSCGILLLPKMSGEHSELLVGGGKEGWLYLVDRLKMGGYNAMHDTSVYHFLAAFSTQATVKAQKRDDHPNASMKELKGQAHHRARQTMAHKQMQMDADFSNIHSAPVYWSSSQGAHVYIWGEVDVLKAFPFKDGKFDEGSVAKGEVKLSDGMPGGMLSLSANGDDVNSGVLWASHPYHGDANHATVQGVLQAFNATPALPGTNRYALDADAPEDKSPRLVKLWDSRKNQADDGGTFAKFCPPTIARGKVYLPSFSGQVSVYGLLEQRQVVPATTDAFVQAGAFRTLPFSARPHKGKFDINSELLWVGRATDTNSSASDGNTCSYLQFDMPDVPFTPQSAMLTLTIPKSMPANAAALIQVYYVPDAGWDSEKITWNNAPGLDRDKFQSAGELVAWHRVAPKRGTVTFDLTNFMARMLNGGTKRITLQLLSANPDHIGVNFISRRRHPQDKTGGAFLTLVAYPK